MGWAAGGNGEVGAGAPSWGHREGCLLTRSLPLPSCLPQTMTVGTIVTRPAAATLALAPSSSATAGAASQSTGPATGTMTAGTTVMRRMPTAPIRVGTWASRAGRDGPPTRLSSPLHVPATWEPEITPPRLLSCERFQCCGRRRLLTTPCPTLLRAQALPLAALGLRSSSAAYYLGGLEQATASRGPLRFICRVGIRIAPAPQCRCGGLSEIMLTKHSAQACVWDLVAWKRTRRGRGMQWGPKERGWLPEGPQPGQRS